MKELIKNRLQKEKRKRFFAGFILSFAATFMLAFYAPLELFSNNLGEFVFDSTMIVPVVFVTFLLAFAVSVLVMFICYIVSEKLYTIALVTYFVAFVGTYIQGNFMTKDIPVLDGSPIDWGGFTKQNVKTFIVWILMLLLSVVVLKIGKLDGYCTFVRMVSVIIFAMLAISLMVVYFVKGANKKKENNLFINEGNMLEMSEDRNFVILLLDCVDARVMSKMMEEYPEYKELFEDFTFYTNTMSTYPYTSQSIPYIMTGQWYKNEQPYEDYYAEAMQNSPLFAELEQRGYSIGVYETEIPRLDNSERFDNIYYTGESKFDKKALAKLEIKTTAFRYVPYFMKGRFEYDNDDFKAIRHFDVADEPFSDVDSDFYEYLNEESVYTKEERAFKFIHIQGAHSPYRYNKNVEKITNATYETNIQACMTITKRYLDMLKEAGVYDNSVILVMADHGYEGGLAQGVDRQNPILFVKGFDENHALLLNDAPISYEDLQDAYVELLDGKQSNEIFPYQEGDVRERKYLLYALNNKDIMYEYIQTGHAKDMSTMKETGVVYECENEKGLMYLIAKPFKAIIGWIYDLIGNMGVAIILFTLLTKLILLPVSIWVQYNSIKMVKMQPELNRINAKFYGDKETISEKQAELFKKEKYNPLVSVIPMAIQLILLMIVIDAIKGAMNGVGINTLLFTIDLRIVPKSFGGPAIFSPILAALSAWVMCYTQNKSNVLQSEQGKFGQYGAMILSVLLSLYLGWFVSIGVVVYWISSNLMSVAQMYILNYFINPKKYVDYGQLEQSKKELSELKNIGGENAKDAKKYAKREKEDYRKFFNIDNKHVVFYSENTGFYKYYKGMIEYLLEHTNMTIHYVTSDPEDAIFELAKTKTAIKPYYIGEKRLITLFMKMEADVVVMTMPDLENYHIKRSYVKNDIEYIYVPHGMDSLNLTMRTGSMDHYDTVFCVGPHQKEEIEKTEEVYQLKKKKLVDWGYSLLDEMIASYEQEEKTQSDRKLILIAPSWQDDNIVDSCLDEILENLKTSNWNIIVRPHPQHVRHRKEKMEQLKARFADNENIEIQTDFSSNSSVFQADLLISDWSGIAYEYAYATKKPVLFINTPMKVMNPEYKEIDTVPLNIMIREELGCAVSLDQIHTVKEKAEALMARSDEYREKITAFTEAYVYNHGTASEVAAKYIFETVSEKIKKRSVK